MELLGPIVLVLILVLWAGIAATPWLRRRRGRKVSAPVPARLATWVAVLAGIAGAAVHAYGLSYQPYLFPEDACWFNAGVKVSPDSSSVLPVSLVCAGREVVPGWLNPTLLLLAVTVVAATAVAVGLRVRARARKDRA
ncbi:hypothetical protein [Streptomyces sp. NPDC048659]|uniref:hypothetical protein n=1 Tax=Streptomyces sp. NPDC048659 TaxID=3155489 RepID=UPI003420B73C